MYNKATMDLYKKFFMYTLLFVGFVFLVAIVYPGSVYAESDDCNRYTQEPGQSACATGKDFYNSGRPITDCESLPGETRIVACQTGYASVAPRPAPPPPSCDGVDPDPDGGRTRIAACEAGLAYANGDTSKECGRLYPDDQSLWDKCVEGYDLQENPKNPRPKTPSQVAAEDRQAARRDYLKKLKEKAPRGYELPSSTDPLGVSNEGDEFCKYYKYHDSRWPDEHLAEACALGYEVGYGSGLICAEEYLFGFGDDLYVTNPVSQGLKDALPENTDDANVFRKRAIDACIDGWTQYKVDYWICDGDKACQQSLRVNKKRVYDPGPRPNRSTSSTTVDPSRTPPGLVRPNNAGSTSKECGGTAVAFLACPSGNTVDNSSLWQVLQIVMNIFIALVGIAATGGLVFGAIKYASAGDDPGSLNEAKTFIRNVLVGLVTFVLMWAITEYLVPGGIIS